MIPERRRVLGWLGAVFLAQPVYGTAFATPPKPLFIAVNESPRELRRLHYLREWSYEQDE